ncbi:thioredoxin [Candidatus Bathyarchaeota archaeon]|nr:thioredoxin [Candidatus Bathyarchaeota archaeon]
MIREVSGVWLDYEDELEKIRREKLKKMMMKFRFNKNEALLRNPIEMDDKNFDEVIRGNPLVVVDFWASWCGPCRMVAPIIEELAKEYNGRILFGKVNVDDNRLISLRYNIKSIPTFLIFKDGKLVDRIVGALPKDIMEKEIKKHL